MSYTMDLPKEFSYLGLDFKYNSGSMALHYINGLVRFDIGYNLYEQGYSAKIIISYGQMAYERTKYYKTLEECVLFFLTDLDRAKEKLTENYSYRVERLKKDFDSMTNSIDAITSSEGYNEAKQLEIIQDILE